MKKILYVLLFLTVSVSAKADSVILMIGDGMGINHLKCAEQSKPIFIPSLPIKGTVHTYSANSAITDSAASATAYSCGMKTNNYYLAKLPDHRDCLTIAEEAVQKGLSVGIYSTDHDTGATPSAFYAHTTDRNNKEKINRDKGMAAQTMDIEVPVKRISDKLITRLKKLSKNPNQKDFFAMFEGAKIDANSHINEFEKMKKELYDFDLAVNKASYFVYEHPDTTLIVLADHETGGLTEECKFSTRDHTGADIPLYAYGKHAKMFEGEQDNTEIHHKIHQILFSK